MDIIENEEFESIIKDINDSEEFQKTKEIIHHCSNRYDHCRRVAYYSYLITKKLHLSYEEVARAGMLHDFFLVDNKDITFKEKLGTLMNHPKYALKYSEKFFELTDKEKDIISTHMFPIAPTRIPKYLESWIVNLVDDYVAIKEEYYAKKKQLISYANFVLAFAMLDD
jgi:uncharacterized protein